MNASESTIVETAPASDGPCLKAGDNLTIYTVEDFASACKAEMVRSSAIRIDLSRVETCDSLGIQVLCALRRSADATRKSVEFANPTPAVQRAAAAIGCESLFATFQP